MIYLIDNYDSFTYNLYQLVGTLTAEPITVIKNDALTPAELIARHPSKLIFSPGPGRPEQAGAMMAQLHALIGRVPILGVCLGHQALALAYGGQVGPALELMHGRPSSITVNQAGRLFAGCPSTFTGARYHSLAITQCPAALQVTATADDGTIMAVADEARAVYGVQFHPESIMTEPTVGAQIIRNFLSI